MGTLEDAEEHIRSQEKELRELMAQNEYLDNQLCVQKKLVDDAGTLVESVATLQLKVKELEGDIDLAHATNKNLHAQIDALKDGGVADDSVLLEQREGLQAAENHRKQLEKANDTLTSTVAAQEVKINVLKNDIRDRKHQPVAG